MKQDAAHAKALRSSQENVIDAGEQLLGTQAWMIVSDDVPEVRHIVDEPRDDGQVLRRLVQYGERHETVTTGDAQEVGHSRAGIGEPVEVELQHRARPRRMKLRSVAPVLGVRQQGMSPRDHTRGISVWPEV